MGEDRNNLDPALVDFTNRLDALIRERKTLNEDIKELKQQAARETHVPAEVFAEFIRLREKGFDKSRVMAHFLGRLAKAHGVESPVAPMAPPEEPPPPAPADKSKLN